MTRRPPGYYAFRCHTRSSGLRRLLVVDGKARADGQLLRFPSPTARAAWIADAGEEAREACATRTLPAGWRVEDALDVPVSLFHDDAATENDLGNAEAEE